MRAAFVSLLLFTGGHTMALDLTALWDFKQPALSESRFRAALAQARGDDLLVLHTQIARTHGLRRDFDGARRELALIAGRIGQAGPEAQARYQLELGRSHASATHTPAQRTPEALAAARQAFDAAQAIAREAQLDALAIDAIHMLAFIDTDPADQLRWGQAALAVVLGSSQADAQRWQASVRNNIGYALHQLGRLDEALAQFEQALALRERANNANATRTARWMVAWTLRGLGRSDEALALQLQLEAQNAAAGQPDAWVFEELAALYLARGDAPKAAHYTRLQRETTRP